MSAAADTRSWDVYEDRVCLQLQILGPGMCMKIEYVCSFRYYYLE